MEDKLTLQTVSSLEKIFPDAPFTPKVALKEDTMLLNERYAFQIAYYLEDFFAAEVSLEVSGALSAYVTVRKVECTPSMHPSDPGQDDYVLRLTPGLYPDLLKPVDKTFSLYSQAWSSLWVTVAEDCPLPAGSYPLHFAFKKADEILGSCDFTIHRLDACLPEQKLIYTQWLHADCIANYYGVPAFSEAHWKLTEQYIRSAVHYGINMLLTPLFTPPLDTAIGGERTTVQLVDVACTDKGYTFGFEKLDRWIEISRNCGIEYFEFSHLFTQWGAKAAPKIMGMKNGEQVKLFGWETAATDNAYCEFLKAFLPELMSFVRAKGLEDKCYFHLSDEPISEHLENYKAAKAAVKPYIGNRPIMDACSSYDYYEDGLMDVPVCCTNRIEPFLEHNVPDQWTYYCCSQREEVSNRFFCMPSVRNRVIGIQLYIHHIVGFLHWGFNFWYNRLSVRAIDPYQTTDGEGGFPSGDAFSVYPGEDGALGSIRAEVFYEGLQDMRLMWLMEQLLGREEAMKLIGQKITFKEYPHEEKWLLELRNKCHAALRKGEQNV